METTHKYAPNSAMSLHHGILPVHKFVGYPPGTAPKAAPIRKDLFVAELTLSDGSKRYLGCEGCYINSELRFVIVGHPARDEIRRSWEPVPANLQCDVYTKEGE